jgi:hypothetical protein
MPNSCSKLLICLDGGDELIKGYCTHILANTVREGREGKKYTGSEGEKGIEVNKKEL